MGEYQATYEQIEKCNKKIREINEQLASSDGITMEEEDYLNEELYNYEIERGEAEGYLRELNEIDNGSEYVW